MSAALCAACGEALLPHLGVCFQCDMAREQPLERALQYRRYSVDALALDTSPIIRGLQALAPAQPPTDIDYLVSRRTFDLAFEADPDQEQRLLTFLTQYGARFEPIAEPASVKLALRPCWEGRVREKLAATAAIGLGGWAAGFPLVATVAAMALPILAATAVRTVDRQVVLSTTHVRDLLGPTHPDVLASATRACLRAESDYEREDIRRLLVACAGMCGALRKSGWHLLDPCMRRIDTRLTSVACRVLLLPHAFSFASVPASVEPYRLSSHHADPGGVIANVCTQLDELEHKLLALQYPVNAKGMTAVERALATLTSDVDRAVRVPLAQP